MTASLRLSASQVQTYLNCARKWSWQYVMLVEVPPNPAAELGSDTHGQLETYLLGGEIDFTRESGYIAAAGLQHLPPPGTPGMLVEQEFHFFGPSGHSYLGYKDLEVPGTIYDHKTTSDLRWQKTEAELREDIQATLYATDYFRHHPDEDSVELRWVYYQTKNAKKSAVTAVRVSQDETWKRFLAIEETAKQMEAVSTAHPLDLPPNIDHCSAYGGCPHQGRCNLSPFQKMRSHVEQNKLLSTLAAKKNGTAAAPPAVPSPSIAAAVAGARPAAAFAPGGAHHGVLPQVPAAPPPAGGNALLGRLQAAGAPVAPVAPAAVAAPVAPPPPFAVNPPEYQPPPAPPAAPPASVEAAGQELAASLAQDAAPAARGRGRPSKAVVPPTGLAPKIKTLYVNCGPVGVDVVDASHFIVLGKKKIAEAGIADYRFAEYGQGPGMLAVAVMSEIDALDGVLPALRLDTTTPEGSILAVELMARSSMVVR